jgi:hypothetical protein
MIKEIYTSIQTALENIKNAEGNPLFKHFDLWNQNVQFIEQDSPFETPACFVEFQPIGWETIGNRVQETTLSIRLHVVTPWYGQSSKISPVQSEMLDYLNIPDFVLNALQGMIIEKVGVLTRTASEINHNHERYVDSVEIYQLRARNLGAETKYHLIRRPSFYIKTGLLRLKTFDFTFDDTFEEKI